MPKKVITWVLVADGAHARVLANDGPERGLTRSPGYEVSAPHPPAREIVSDREGRNANRMAGGGGGRHALTPKTEPQRHAAQEFARTVARFLDEAAAKKSYQRLVLVAPPRMLGDLRSALPAHALATVTGEIDKDLVHLDDAAVAKHLAEVVF